MSRARVSVTVVMFLLAGAIIAACIPNPPPDACAQTAHLETHATLAQYAAQAGDQVITIPDGTYTGGSTSTAHPSTSGVCKGWLVLQAQDRGQVVVTGDFSTVRNDAPTPTSSHVIFAGITFKDGVVTNQGQGDTFWYDDISKTDLPAEGETNSSLYLAAQDESIGGQWFGTDIHHTCFGIKVDHEYEDGTHPVVIQGTHIYDLHELGDLPYDNGNCHTDAVADVNSGKIQNLQLDDNWFEGQVILQDYGANAIQGPVHVDAHNDWVSHVFVNGDWPWNYISHYPWTDTSNPWPNNAVSIEGSRSNVVAFDNTGVASGQCVGADRRNKANSVTCGDVDQAGRIVIADSNITNLGTGPRPSGDDPATVWRIAHPYDSWESAIP